MIDVRVVDGLVHPKHDGKWQGMSVQLDPRDLKRHRRPPEIKNRHGLPGEGKHPLFELSEAAIPDSLHVKVTSGTHAVLAPREPMKIADYEAAVSATAGDWTNANVKKFL